MDEVNDKGGAHVHGAINDQVKGTDYANAVVKRIQGRAHLAELPYGRPDKLPAKHVQESIEAAVRGAR